MRLEHMIACPLQDTYIGVLYLVGVGARVGVLSDGQVRQMSAAAARRLARDYRAEDEVAEELEPVSAALEAIADIVDPDKTCVDLADMPADGSA